MYDEKNSLFIFRNFSKILEGSYGPLIQTLGIVLFVLIFNFLIRTLLLNLSVRFEKQQKVWPLSFVSALQKPLAYLVWFIATICTIDILTSSLLSFHLAHIHMILSIGVVLAFGCFLWRWNSKVVHYMMGMSQSHKIPLAAGKLDILSKLARISIIFVIIFLLMVVTGQNMQTIIAFGGIGGLSLAFASQQVISNFFGGLMIYITQPFTIGEYVSLPERRIEGHIEEIGWYLTLIRSLEKKPIYVPNSIFTQTIVMTPSRTTHERFHHTIGLRYRDINILKPIVNHIKFMLLREPTIDHELNVEVFFKNFGATTLDIEISAYMPKEYPATISAVRQDILLKIADIIVQEGAELAIPTHLVEVQGGIATKHPQFELAES